MPMMQDYEELAEDGLDKIYYKIRDVARMLDVAPSALRYWEAEFEGLKPRRSGTNQRYYTPDDIRLLRIIKYLVKTKGLRVEAAKEELAKNRSNVSRRLEAVELLQRTRSELKQLLDSLNKRRT